MTKRVFEAYGGRASLWQVSEDGSRECIRFFTWRTGGHVCEVVGEGDRQRRVEVMVSPSATMGAFVTDEEAHEALWRHLGKPDWPGRP